MKRYLFFAVAVLLSLSSPAQTPRWKASWITAGEIILHPNLWTGYYRDVDISSVPSTLKARIGADSRYWLWINGEMVVREGGVKRGPNRSDSYYDEVEIAPYLRAGHNDIAVMLWHFGRDGFSHNSSGKPAVIFDAQGESVEILSDDSWKSVVLSEFGDVAEPHVNHRLPESDILYDARLVDNGWRRGFSDRYMKVMSLGVAGDSPWGKLHRNPLPLWKDWGVCGYVASELHKDAGTGCDTLVCSLPYDAQIHPILKFASVQEGVKVKIFTDSYQHFSNKKVALPVHAEYVTAEGAQEFECWDWLSGNKVYYVLPAGFPLPAVSYRETGYNADFAGDFSCSSNFWNRYWSKSARTLYINMRDTFFDCPDRERAQWTGDAVNNCEQSFYILSRDTDALGGKWLRELCGWQKSDGAIYAPVPSGNWTRELSGQSLSSVGYYGLWTYYMQSGDLNILEDTYDAVDRYLAMWTTCPDGTVEYRHGEWEWGDWGREIDQVALINALYYHALKGHQLAAAELGKTDEAARLTTRMERFRKGFNERFWNGKAYRSENYRGRTDDRVQALAAVCGLAYRQYFPEILSVLTTERHASPYMERYVFQALCEMGYGEFGLKRFEERFADIVSDTRYTTLPEGWGYVRGGTFNHAWSGGGVIPMANHIIGIRPLKPGYSRFCIDPHPCGLKKASLKIQTAYGEISVSYEVHGKNICLDFTVPEGCICETFIGGRTIWMEGHHKEIGKIQ